MKKISKYIYEVLGHNVQPHEISINKLGRLPLFIIEAYHFFGLTLFNRNLTLAAPKDEENFSVLQIGKQFAQIKEALGSIVILLADNLNSIKRHRLIEQGINFIVPDKQLFLPDLLLDLRESFPNPKARTKEQHLLPSAQFILLYHLLHRFNNTKTEKRPSLRVKDLPDYNMAEYPLYKLAKKFGYSKMTISNAADDLKYHGLCMVTGGKEKYIEFEYGRSELWHMAQKLLVTPVIKKVYIDERPPVFLYGCNAWALPEYSDMNKSRQECYAIEKGRFYELQKKGQLKNLNDSEGDICLEVWRYDPEILSAGITETANVDPLSLYLSLADSRDERIEMALEKIIEDYIW